jgi:predicted amidohydrolase
MASYRCLAAVGQMTATSSIEANFALCTHLARQAVSRGARMLFLPECFHFIGGDSEVTSASIAEPLEGPSMRRYCELARTCGLWLSLGGFQHRRAGATHPSNTHVVIGADGCIRGSYDKMHLFDVDIPSQGVSLKESAFTTAGEEIVAVPSTPVGTLGLSVCYDLRFPQVRCGAPAAASALASLWCLPRISAAVPSPCSCWRPGSRCPCCFYSSYRRSALGGQWPHFQRERCRRR